MLEENYGISIQENTIQPYNICSLWQNVVRKVRQQIGIYMSHIKKKLSKETLGEENSKHFALGWWDYGVSFPAKLHFSKFFTMSICHIDIWGKKHLQIRKIISYYF